MTPRRTIASIRVSLEHDRERLLPRAALDEDGDKLLHDIKDILNTLDMWDDTPPEPRELVAEVRALSNKAANVRERVTDYITGRRMARVANMLPDSTRPPADTVAQIRYAQEGPSRGPEAETMEACPACRHCTLCGDRRFVSVSTATEWRLRNLPRGET